MADGIRRQEIICIQGGQGGVQLGNAMWELLTIEHDISACGMINNPPDDVAFTTFFSQSSNNQYFPRAIIFDTEPTVVDEIRCGHYRKLFHPDMIINGNEDASNNFARGYLSEAKLLLYPVVDKIRHLIENCNNFSGFLVQSGTAGGTGSGLLSALMEHLSTEFAGRPNVQLSIFPGQKLSNCIVQPYNCVLSTEKLVYCSDLNILVDNEMLYAISCNLFDIERPSFTNINRIISRILSGLTAPIRFSGMINSDLREISTNLVPYPSLHFPLVSYAPLSSNDKLNHELLNHESLTRSLFQEENQFIDVDLKKGFFLSSVLLFRGSCDLSSILKTLQSIKREKDFHWVDWCPTGFKISHTMQRPTLVPINKPSNFDKAAMMISNHSGIASNLISMENKFNILLKRKAYIHWYVGEGMEEDEFFNAINEVNVISKDYSCIMDQILNNPSELKSSLKLQKDPTDSLTISDKKLEWSANNNNLSDMDIEVFIEKTNDEKLDKSKETPEKKEISYEVTLPTDDKSRYTERGYSINSSSQTKQSQLLNKPDLFTDKFSNHRSTEDSHNVSNKIYEICERNYFSETFKTTANKRKFYRPISPLKYSSNENIIKKIFRKNKVLFNQFMHSEKYEITASQTN